MLALKKGNSKSSHVLETYTLVMNKLVEYNRNESEFTKYMTTKYCYIPIRYEVGHQTTYIWRMHKEGATVGGGT